MREYRKTGSIRGIRLDHRKNTAECETVTLPAGETVTIPLAMHIGAPALPVVEKGQQVYVGTLIGRAASFVSANIHASVSGTVEKLDRVLFADGQYKQAVVIRSDGKNTPDPSLAPPAVTTRDELVAAVAASGLVGLGGAGFPMHVKLSPPKDRRIDTLIVNAAECEPYITSDYREMMESPDDVIEGLALVMKFLSIPNGVLAIESNKPRAIRLMQQKTACLPGVRVQKLSSRYPQGAEKMLIANTVGRAVPIGKLPSDVGCIVVNVTSLSFISKYLRTGMPLVRRRLTVDGSAVRRPGNYSVPVGIKVRDLIESCGGYAAECRELIMGGPMMGNSLYTDDFPILKSTNAILALTSAEMRELTIEPCIHCGRCVHGCPMRLSPVEIAAAFDRGDLALAGRLGVSACVECGCCSYVCPAKRPLTQRMKMAKIELRKAGKK